MRTAEAVEEIVMRKSFARFVDWARQIWIAAQRERERTTRMTRAR